MPTISETLGYKSRQTLSEDELRSIFGYDEMPDGLGKNYLVATGKMKIQDLISDEFADTPNPNAPNAPKSL